MYYEAIISFTKDQQQVGSNMPGAAVTRFLVQADSLAEAEAHVDGIGDRFGLDGDRAFNSMDLPPDVAAAEGRFMTKERVIKSKRLDTGSKSAVKILLSSKRWTEPAWWTSRAIRSNTQARPPISWLRAPSPTT